MKKQPAAGATRDLGRKANVSCRSCSAQARFRRFSSTPRSAVALGLLPATCLTSTQRSAPNGSRASCSQCLPLLTQKLSWTLPGSSREAPQTPRVELTGGLGTLGRLEPNRRRSKRGGSSNREDNSSLQVAHISLYLEACYTHSLPAPVPIVVWPRVSSTSPRTFCNFYRL